MNLVIIGTGYVGLTTGLGLAKLGNRVACVDTDAAKISKLDMGEAPFFEPGLVELLKEMQEAGRILFTTDLSAVVGGADIIIIAVGTPSLPSGEANLSFVHAAIDAIGRTLEREAVIVMKSTVPVGTNRLMLERVKESLRKAGHDDLTSVVAIASVPEFLREGSAFDDFAHPDRIVIGADDDVTLVIVDQMHQGIEAPRAFMSLESAELTKYAANAFLATKISFINEIANIAERAGADVRDIAKGIGLDRRIGSQFLHAGIGYGGSCFPKDVSALAQISGLHGYDFKLLSSVIEVNNHQRERFFQMVEYTLGNLRGRRIGVWGLAFKPGTDDIRASAAIDIVQRLFAHGADVSVYDPQAMDSARAVLSDRVSFAPTPIDAATGAEALLILTEWPQFKDVSLSTLRTSMLEPRIFDGRNLFADAALHEHGFSYVGVGLCPRGRAS